MSEVAQLEHNEPVTATSPQPSSAQSSSEYRYAPGASRPADADLYAFRAVIAQQDLREAQAEPPKPALNAKVIILAVLALAAAAALFIYAGPMLLKPKVDNLYVDLGTERYDPAGLGGRLIAQWEGSAAYKLTIDPLDSAQIPGFRAVIANPPHAITFTLRLKDAAGLVACQKDIVIPGTQESSDPLDKSQPLAEHTTPTGDTIQNQTGDNGQIGEMELSGPLPCSIEVYKKIVAWDFTTDFPPLSAQKVWEKHEEAVARRAKAGGDSAPRTYAGYTFVRSLPAPIEADDAIVGDNPSKGVVVTGGGRAFLVGTSVLVNPALDWQIFPADVHYRCDKNALCTVTRLNSRSVVHAHLLR